MNEAELARLPLNVIGKGEADQPDLPIFDARLRAVVRYADEAAWTTATAVARAIDPVREIVAAARDSVAVLAVGDHGPQETMQALEKAARAGFSSPLRFPAGNPGSLVGVTCILFGFRGPTLNFTLPPQEGVPVGLEVAAQWLRRRVVEYVVLSTCGIDANTRPVTRSLLLATDRSANHQGEPLTAADVAWLASVDA